MASSVTSGADGFAEQELARAWEKVEARVVKMAGGDPAMLRRNLGIDGVMMCLRQAQAESKKAADKNADVKDVFTKTLKAIEVVGGIVVSGCGMVFGPACTCYNALTFVIQAWRGYDGIFDSLTVLLRKCSEFLDRLSYYAEGKMDSKLTRVASLHLELFVEICDRSLKLREKRHKLTAFMKQLFFMEDDSIQSLLGSMQGLVDKEQGLVLAQTWKSSKEAAEFSRKLFNSVNDDKNQSKKDKEVDHWKRTIVRTLECDPVVLDPKIQNPWDKALTRSRAAALEGTGDWLIQDPRYLQWIAGTGSTGRLKILGLEGDQGTGKTLMASTIILNLGNSRTKSVGARPIVSFNFVDPDSRPNSAIKGGQSWAYTMSKNILCQLALGDGPLLKSMAAICEKNYSFRTPTDMWEKLLHDNEDLIAMDATIFFVLDGIRGNVDAVCEILDNLSASKIANKVRVLITEGGEAFDDLRVTARGADFDLVTIPVERENLPDIHLYIKHRLDGMDILREKERAGVSDIRKKILAELPRSTNGDYYKIERILDKISKTDDPDEINRLLKFSGSARLDQIGADIRKLNEIRTEKEILEINELILWVNNMYDEFPTVHVTDGIFELAYPNTTSSSLMSMASKIKTKYTIFSVAGGVINYPVPETRDKIPLKAQVTWDNGEKSDVKEISHNEVAMIKHYLSTLCPKIVYDKFGFDEFFDGKLVRRGVYIYQDPDNAHISLALRCIRCLVNPRSEKTELLYQYCQEKVMRHLRDTDLSLADRALKTEAGDNLERLFTESQAVSSLFGFAVDDGRLEDDTRFSAYIIPSHWEAWILQNDGVTCVAKWFKDSAVIERAKSSALVSAFNAPDADQHGVLFEAAKKEAATTLFRKRTARTGTLLAFAFLYMSIERKNLPYEEDWGILPTPAMIKMVEEWARVALNCPETDVIWETRAADLLCHLGDYNEEAQTRAKNALAIDPNHWQASYALARATYRADESAKILRPIVDARMNDWTWRANPVNKITLQRMVYILSNKYWKDPNTQDLAREFDLKLLDIDRSPEALRRYTDVLDDHAGNGRWHDIIAFMDKILDEPEDQNTMRGFFVNNTYPLISHIMPRAIRATKRYDLLERLFAKSYKSDLPPSDSRQMQMYHGFLLMEVDGFEKRAIDVLDKLGRELVNPPLEMIRIWGRLALQPGASPADAAMYHNRIVQTYSKNESLIHANTQHCVNVAQYYQARQDWSMVTAILKIKVSEALEMLADDDLDNDSTSLFVLNVIFSLVRDMENLAVTWELMSVATKAQAAEYRRKSEVWKRLQAEKSLVDLGEASINVAGGSESTEDEGPLGEKSTELRVDRKGSVAPVKSVVIEVNERPDGTQVIRTGEEEVDADEVASISDSGSSPPPYSEVGEHTWWNMGRRLTDEEIQSQPLSSSAAFEVSCSECNQSERNMYGLWHCMTCAGQHHLDDGCYQKLMRGMGSPIRCTPEHEWIRIPARDKEKMDAIPTGSVLVGNRIVTYEDWKAEIRAKYVDRF